MFFDPLYENERGGIASDVTKVGGAEIFNKLVTISNDFVRHHFRAVGFEVRDVIVVENVASDKVRVYFDVYMEEFGERRLCCMRTSMRGIHMREKIVRKAKANGKEDLEAYNYDLVEDMTSDVQGLSFVRSFINSVKNDSVTANKSVSARLFSMLVRAGCGSLKSDSCENITTTAVASSYQDRSWAGGW